ncbi:MAG: hypothetical protein VZR53_10470 [Prevotella sp.]|nr:hypothetical protein [Prevotella sp.]
MKTYFLVAVVVAGITEWFKNFLPEKVKENNKAMAGIAAAFSVIAAVGYQFANKAINPSVVLSWQSITIFTAIVVGLTQTCYNVLVQTFKAVKTKLTEKAKVDPDEIANDLADKIIDGVTGEVQKATSLRDANGNLPTSDRANTIADSVVEGKN